MHKKKLYLGIDPGFTGALAIIDQLGELENLIDMPVKPKGHERNDLRETNRVRGFNGTNEPIGPDFNDPLEPEFNETPKPTKPPGPNPHANYTFTKAPGPSLFGPGGPSLYVPAIQEAPSSQRHMSPTFKRSPTRVKKEPVELDPIGLANFIRKYSPYLVSAMMEKVHSMPGQGVVSVFRFGEGYGILQGVFSQFPHIRVVKTPPAVWKAQMGLSANKNLSLQKARELAGFADGVKYFSRLKDNGRAEAYLLAHLGLRLRTS